MSLRIYSTQLPHAFRMWRPWWSALVGTTACPTTFPGQNSPPGPSSVRRLERLSKGVEGAEVSQAGWEWKLERERTHLDQGGCPRDSKVDFHPLLENCLWRQFQRRILKMQYSSIWVKTQLPEGILDSIRQSSQGTATRFAFCSNATNSQWTGVLIWEEIWTARKNYEGGNISLLVGEAWAKGSGLF